MAHKVGGVELATKYLEEEGGLAEAIQYASDIIMNGGERVEMNADIAFALCCLADEALKLRQRNRLAAEYK